MAVFGCSVEHDKKGATSRVMVICDRQKVIDNFPMIQKLGLMNPDITQTQINMAPDAWASVFMQELAADLVHPFYQGTDAQNTAWYGALKAPDDYGHLQDHTVFTFRFTRALDAKIDWDHFEDANLSKIAPGFTLTPYGEMAIQELN